MIDFDNSAIFKLKPIDNSKAREDFSRFLIDGEDIFAVFKTIRDQVVFTNKRIIAANVQGITGSKVDYTSIPFSKIQAFSIETSGSLDLDCEIQIYISAVGKVTFEIKGEFDIVAFNRMISVYVLT
ncbi:PH domain-containing protein [Psychromonas ossibalaenae]|uniref:PH domain-containing protein n=1 Tax=Psychromonas ossibalaenae TaxID=444922 RepID=UPI00036C47C0|nr:PH domain-containing protein [Psychromonas ossibalaenae]